MILGISISKSTTWRGTAEEFANVYHYDATADTMAVDVIDAVVAEERKVMGNNVNFLRAQAWGPADGTKLQSQMLVQKNLTGVGAVATGEITAKEMAAVVQWDTGRVNTRGGKIFYRKYLHIGRLNGTDAEGAKGNGPLLTAAKDLIVAYGNNVKNVVGINGASICDKQGRKLPLNTAPVVLPHLHTRQFRR
jgi:hypothetical protein